MSRFFTYTEQYRKQKVKKRENSDENKPMVAQLKFYVWAIL